MADRLTVFYDGGCPLCRREIGFYRRRRGAESICWRDISEEDAGDVAPGLSRDEAMARFHVRLQDGTLVSGGGAFRAVWRSLPGFRVVAKPLGLPGVRWLMDRAYDVFLRVRPALQRAATDSKEATASGEGRVR